MAAGDLITADYQYEFNGLLMGHGTPYITTKWTGLLGQAPIVQYHSKAQARHGVFYGYEVMDARTAECDVAIDSDSIYAASAWSALGPSAHAGDVAEYLLTQLLVACAPPAPFQSELTVPLSPEAVDMALVFKRPNKNKRCVYGHIIKSDFDSDAAVALGLAVGSLQWYCGDPRAYDISASVQNMTIPAGATQAPAVVVTNAGNIPSSKGIITINGPATNPFITNTTVNRALRFNRTLAPGDVMQVDLFLKTITVNGVNAYAARRSDLQWFEIMPGNNSLVASRQSSDGTQCSCSISFQNAYAGAA